MKRILVVFFVIPVLFVFTACQTTDIEIDENLTPGEYFQKAQAASSENKDYQLALKYYNTFIERYPDNVSLGIEAEYEIALLYYKMSEEATALQLFKGILDRYQQPEAAMLPAWPEVLSKKLIDIIESKPKQETAESGATAEE